MSFHRKAWPGLVALYPRLLARGRASTRSRAVGRAATCVLLASTAACTSDPEVEAEPVSADSGSLALVLAGPDALQHKLLQYQVLRLGGSELQQGAVSVGENGMARRLLERLAPGRWQVSVTSLQDLEICEGSAEVTIRVGETTVVSLAVRCARTPEAVDGTFSDTFNICPRVLAVWALPAKAALGESVLLAVEAIDRDGDALLYEWTGGDGMLSSPNAPVTHFACTSLGVHQFVATVGDSTGAFRSRSVSCSKPSPVVSVECTSPTALLDAGLEPYDAGNEAPDTAVRNVTPLQGLDAQAELITAP